MSGRDASAGGGGYGIPEFRMEKRHLDRRLEQMRAEGTRFRAGVAVGTGLDAAGLRQGVDAVVVAVGATVPRELPGPGRGPGAVCAPAPGDLRVRGRDLAGIYQAMEYLAAANRACAGDFGGRPRLSAHGR